MRTPACCVVFVVSMLSVATAPAQALAYDGFGNGPRADLDGSTGGVGWPAPWSNGGTDPTGIAGGGLVYPGLATTPGAAVTAAAGGSWPATFYTRALPTLPPGTNTLYVSFLLRLDSGAGTWGGLRFGQYPYAMSVGVPLGTYTWGLMVSQGLGANTNHTLVANATTLGVVRITLGAVGGTTYSLFVDPVVGQPEPGTADASFALAMVAALPTSLALDNATGFTTDEIRVGTTWNAVLPPGASVWTDLGFAKPGVWGAPHLAGSGPFAPNTNNTLSLTSANANAACWLVIGFLQPQNSPFLGGVLVPEPVLVSPMSTDAAGAGATSIVVPGFVPAGLPVLFQCWIQDPAATAGFAASNGLRGVVQ